jgi:hypothetical protein
MFEMARGSRGNIEMAGFFELLNREPREKRERR